MMWRLDRTMVTAMAGNALIGAVFPFVGIYLSEYVLDHIGPGCDVRTLLKVVFASVGAVFVLMVASGYLKKMFEVAEISVSADLIWRWENAPSPWTMNCWTARQ